MCKLIRAQIRTLLYACSDSAREPSNSSLDALIFIVLDRLISYALYIICTCGDIYNQVITLPHLYPFAFRCIFPGAFGDCMDGVDTHSASDLNFCQLKGHHNKGPHHPYLS